MNFLKIMFIVVSMLSVINAHKNTSYNHDSQAVAHNPKWMQNLDDELKLSELSLPGTHDTMALYESRSGSKAQTQSMLLLEQLNSGIRVLDVRPKYKSKNPSFFEVIIFNAPSKFKNEFPIYHGLIFQKTYFNDVLETVTEFLRKNPSETILMKIHKEGNSRDEDFVRTFNKYQLQYDKYFWKGNNIWHINDNPRLKETRGKIVILREFARSNFGIHYDTRYGDFSILNFYNLNSKNDLFHKWDEAKAHLLEASSANKNKFYVTNIVGSGDVSPYFVASGHVNPDTNARRRSSSYNEDQSVQYPNFPMKDGKILYEGLNTLIANFIQNKNKRIGIIFADFPGRKLIKNIINNN